QHNMIRERIEAVARSRGFYPAREKLLPDGKKIDLALESPGQIIACEISITNSIDNEVGHIDKCLKAGCHHVAVIAGEAKLAKIQAAASVCFPARNLARVAYY